MSERQPSHNPNLSGQRDRENHGQAGHECEDGTQRPTKRPNPCSPLEKPNDCHCHDKTGSPVRKPKPPHKKVRPDSCCDQFIELLRSVKDLNLPEPHKPKQRPARKIRTLCNALGVSDAVLPALAFLWHRYQDGSPGRNQFEQKVEQVFATILPKDRDALDDAMKAYRKLRKSGKAECLFNDCLVKAGEDSPIERDWFAGALLGEGLKIAGQIVFSGSEGIMGPGATRLWDNAVARGPNGSGATIYQGPWPWITSIGPDISSYEEYGNLESFRPVPGGAHVWQNYQYSQTCTYTPDPSGSINANCEREHPVPPPPGTLFNFCEGGQNYTKGNDCLRIPAQRPGGSIKLKGFNFITPTVKVLLRHTTDASVSVEQECIVWGDQKTPVKDATDHYIVDERVSDWLDVPLPSSHPTIPGAPLPPGLYEVSVSVENVTKAIYDSAQPPVLVSNKLLLRMEADPNIRYLLWSQGGHCFRETPGLGSDEIWWDAFTGHIVPNAVPVPPTGAAPMSLDVQRRTFPRDPWDDMDDGEGPGPYNISIFGPEAFQLYGVVAIAMVGFEVDSEDAAREQLQGFWNAWGKALTDVLNVAVTGGGIASSAADLAVKAGVIAAKTALTVALIALAVVAAITLIGTALWAAWAPADLIALDIFHLDALNAWDMTDPKKPLPPDTHREFGDPNDSDNMVSVHEVPKPKLFAPGDAAATWIEETTYDTPEDGEDSSYLLEFRMARS